MSEAQTSAAVGIYLRTFNWEMKQARRKLGLSQIGFAEITGIPISHIQEIEQLRRVPSHEEALDMSVTLGVEHDTLFPPELIARVKENIGLPTSFEIRLPLEVLSLSTVSPELLPWADLQDQEESADKELLAERIGVALATLRPRERQIIEERFGLKDGKQKTLNEVAKAHGVSKAAIGQMEARALRTLRHPSRSKHLRPFLPDRTPKVTYPAHACQKCGGQMVRRDAPPELAVSPGTEQYLTCFACEQSPEIEAMRERRRKEEAARKLQADRQLALLRGRVTPPLLRTVFPRVVGRELIYPRGGAPQEAPIVVCIGCGRHFWITPPGGGCPNCGVEYLMSSDTRVVKSRYARAEVTGVGNAP